MEKTYIYTIMGIKRKTKSFDDLVGYNQCITSLLMILTLASLVLTLLPANIFISALWHAIVVLYYYGYYET